MSELNCNPEGESRTVLRNVWEQMIRSQVAATLKAYLLNTHAVTP